MSMSTTILYARMPIYMIIIITLMFSDVLN